jgi:hypothetical protein
LIAAGTLTETPVDFVADDACAALNGRHFVSKLVLACAKCSAASMAAGDTPNDETFLFGPCSLPMTDVGLQLLDFPCSPREESNVRYMRADALTACKTSREVIKCPSTPSLTPNANVF